MFWSNHGLRGCCYKLQHGTTLNMPRTASLELQLEEASVVRGGPPLCDCGDEMVHREVCNMADPNWGRHFWKCPRRPVCCERREWDDSVPATDISCARIGG
ncbi:unnamed protein product [Polarella glacialis]|uniref:GRF-type domain-containing protein n=1 Tax=Polarella glacialis TaxID=89957 RepID=A0A813FP59_POLGL|nr:unnamed protein product [Polarella glacialis]